jgi:hypothetical protein
MKQACCLYIINSCQKLIRSEKNWSKNISVLCEHWDQLLEFTFKCYLDNMYFGIIIIITIWHYSLDSFGMFQVATLLVHWTECHHKEPIILLFIFNWYLHEYIHTSLSPCDLLVDWMIYFKVYTWDSRLIILLGLENNMYLSFLSFA